MPLRTDGEGRGVGGKKEAVLRHRGRNGGRERQQQRRLPGKEAAQLENIGNRPRRANVLEEEFKLDGATEA